MVRELIAFLIRWSGIPFLIIRFYAKSKVPILVRYEAVFEVWGNVTLRRLIFGQSQITDAALGSFVPHTAYLGIPLTYGIGGAIWAITFFSIMYRKAKTMKRHYDITIASLGSGVCWCLLVFAAVGVAGLVLGNLYIRYTLFLLAVLVQRGTELTWEYQLYDDEEMYLYNDQSAYYQQDSPEYNYEQADYNGWTSGSADY